MNPHDPFVIEPLRPVDMLLPLAKEAVPPAEPGPFRPSDFVRLADMASRVRCDLRYATPDNFLGTRMYPEAAALLQRPAAEALARVQADLERLGLGLVVYDAYRPWWVTWLFWEATPPEFRTFVATPSLGSRHNRGCAVDVGLVDLSSGHALPMPSGYDEFTERAYVSYGGGPSEARRNRDLLISAMGNRGFTVYEAEWWHYDHPDWAHYAIENRSFGDLTPPPPDRKVSPTVRQPGGQARRA